MKDKITLTTRHPFLTLNNPCHLVLFLWSVISDPDEKIAATYEKTL